MTPAGPFVLNVSFTPQAVVVTTVGATGVTSIVQSAGAALNVWAKTVVPVITNPVLAVAVVVTVLPGATVPVVVYVTWGVFDGKITAAAVGVAQVGSV